MCAPGAMAIDTYLKDPGKALANLDPFKGSNSGPGATPAPGSNNGQSFKGAERAATAAPTIGARRRGGMGAGSLLTGPSGIAQGALTTGKSSLLGQ